MKTITIKLAEQDAKELGSFIKRRHYPSKSEFIRGLIMEKMDAGVKERQGWLALAEKSLDKLWDNKKDEKVWGKYL